MNLIAQAKEGLSFAQAASFVPQRNGKRVHASTVMRWTREGVLGPNGERVYLRTLQVGGRKLVTLENLERFLTALNSDEREEPTEEMEGSQQRRAREAKKALEALGI